MTRQEIFDRVVAHLRKQNAQAMNGYGDCMYRTIDGKSCAVGCLIADEHYDSRFEGLSVTSVTNSLGIDYRSEHCDLFRQALRKSGVPVDYVPAMTLLYRMQRIHDGSPVDYWEDCFKELAHELNLVYTPRPLEDDTGSLQPTK